MQVQNQQTAAVITTGTAVSQPLQRYAPNRAAYRVDAIKGLALTQLCIGVLSASVGLACSIVLDSYWVNNTYAGIWVGVWIFLTGAIGLTSSSNPENSGLIRIHMAFCIVACILSLIDGIFFMVGLVYSTTCEYNYSYYYSYSYNYYYYNTYHRYSDCDINPDEGKGFFASLMLLMVTEFFVALVAAIFCCNACCARANPGVIIQQQPQYQVVTSSTGQSVLMPVGPTIYVNPVSNPYQSGQQGAYYQQAGYGQPTGTGFQQASGVTNVSYSHDQQQQEQRQQQQFDDTEPIARGEAPPAYKE